MKEELTEKKIEELAYAIHQLFKNHGIWSDAVIYFNGMALSNKDEKGQYHYDGSAYLHKDMDPLDSFPYVNPQHILSMSFEGSMARMFNQNFYPDTLREFVKLLADYDLYYELGNTWNLTCYQI